MLQTASVPAGSSLADVVRALTSSPAAASDGPPQRTACAVLSPSGALLALLTESDVVAAAASAASAGVALSGVAAPAGGRGVAAVRVPPLPPVDVFRRCAVAMGRMGT